uniref:protein-tyrosine-phosphatase n=1 Tax=Romanomermis culicivorax TaxID=13658 RepID=A0A915JW10_ROMCU
RLYFDYGIKGSPKDNKECHFFTTDNNADFHYEKFYKDFGPFNVAVLYKFCTLLHEKMKLVSLSKKRLIYYIASRDEEKRSNAAYLIGSFSILYLHMTCEGVCKLFCKREERPFLPFRDAAPGDSNYGLRLFDVFRAIEKANNLKWIDFENFDLNEYEFFENFFVISLCILDMILMLLELSFRFLAHPPAQLFTKVENGDLNWIIPRKILAFCGPHLRSTDEDGRRNNVIPVHSLPFVIFHFRLGYPRHSPETYFDYFKKHNVTNIVRLNRKVYESSRFTEAGFRHDDLFFVDGSTPSNAIVLKFIKLIEDSSGAVAVHCKAGLGRTGTLIACYMMKHYGFTAPECMAWIRICRPGSIIGPQQQFLIHVQNWCRSLPGSNCRTQSPDNNTRLDKSHQVVSPDVLSQGVDRV